MTPRFRFAGGRSYRLTAHVLIRLAQREAQENWITQVLENPVAVVDDEAKHSMNYYGFIAERSSLFKVVVSTLEDEPVVTVYFDSLATARYGRGAL